MNSCSYYNLKIKKKIQSFLVVFLTVFATTPQHQLLEPLLRPCLQICFEIFSRFFFLDLGVHGKHPAPSGKESLWLLWDSQSSSDNVKCFDELLLKPKSELSRDDLTDFCFSDELKWEFVHWQAIKFPHRQR